MESSFLVKINFKSYLSLVCGHMMYTSDEIMPQALHCISNIDIIFFQSISVVKHTEELMKTKSVHGHLLHLQTKEPLGTISHRKSAKFPANSFVQLPSYQLNTMTLWHRHRLLIYKLLSVFEKPTPNSWPRRLTSEKSSSNKNFDIMFFSAFLSFFNFYIFYTMQSWHQLYKCGNIY